MRRLLSPWDRRAGPPDSHSPARTDLLSGKEAVKYLRVKLSLPPLRTSCVSPPVFQVHFTSVFAGLSVSQCFGPQLCVGCTPVQTRVGSRFTVYMVGKLFSGPRSGCDVFAFNVVPVPHRKQSVDFGL